MVINLILLTLIKKEVIEFLTKKTNLITMFILPIVLIIVFGTLFNGFMVKDSNIYKDKIIYYRINNINQNNDQLKIFYNFITEFEKDTNVDFIQVNNKDKYIKKVNENKAICLLDIYKDDYYYYRNENKESMESKIFRNAYEQYLKKYNLIKSIQRTNPKNINKILNNQIDLSLNNQEIDSEEVNSKEVNSFTYYTFAQLVLIILYISNLISKSMYRDKYSKFRYYQIILSKIIFAMIVGLLQIIIVYMISTNFLDVSWGNNLFKIILVLISFTIFSSVLGISISMIYEDKKTSYNILNTILIVMCFLGGLYVPICVIKSNVITNFLSDLIPTYWVNLAIIGLSQNIINYYFNISIAISLVLSIIILVIPLILSKLKIIIKKKSRLIITIILSIFILITFSFEYLGKYNFKVGVIDEDNSYISEEIIKVIEDLEDIDVVPLKKSDYKIKLITKQIQMVVIINKGFENNMLNLKNANLIIKSTSQSDIKSIIQSILKVRLEDLTTISKLSEGNINKFKTLYTDYKDIPTQLSLNDIKK